MSDDEQSSKDHYFAQLASISEAMTAAHGKDFAMGALVLAARFIAEGEARAKAAAAGTAPAAGGEAAVPRSDAPAPVGVPEHDARKSPLWTPDARAPGRQGRH